MESAYQLPPLPERISRIISQLSSSQHYFLFYPSKELLQGQYKHLITKQMNPYILIFEDEENTTSQQIAQQFVKQNKLQLKPAYLYFDHIPSGYPLRKTTISDFKRTFQEETIDGFCFEVNIYQLDYEDEASIQDMIKLDQKVRKKSSRTLCCYIPQNQHYFYVEQKGKGNDNFESFTSRITQQIKKELNVAVNVQRLRILFLIRGTLTNISPRNYTKITRKDQIIIQFLDNVALPQANFQNQNNFLIINDFEKGREPIKFCYSKIRKMKVRNILEKFLGFKQRGLEASDYGLRIHNIIVKPCQALSDFQQLEKLFLSDSKYIKVILAIVIKEAFIFYAHLDEMQQINTPKNQQLFNSIIYKSAQNETYRRNCTVAIKQRAQSAIQSAFRNNQERIYPILYYTSELIVQQNGKFMKLYEATNCFMRTLPFGNTERSDYKKWQFSFSKSLISNLKLIEEYIGDLYRGISHKQQYHEGKIVKFKQFSSCSTDRLIAESFATTTLYIFKNCRVGRRIRDYSFFQKEEEVLNLPYTEYKVINTDTKKIGQALVEVVTLEEVYCPDIKFDLKDQRQLFVLWLDRKPQPGKIQEGIQISRNVCQIQQTTFFIHLKSTKQLENWLNESKRLLKDPTVSLALITNMCRQEDGSWNQNAGVEAIKCFRSYSPQSKIMLYIGDIQLARKKLKQNNIEVGGNLSLGNQQNSVLQFFSNHCGIC